ncbi:hypothetical protein ACF0H5_001907 [Mactra antiquata]
MSFEEPKAPIVRIRKKRVKKKSKDNDIVHLPVRASQQARYSSLTTPPNPQTKGRECCRHAFVSCMKIPGCRMMCFKCILPKCYGGEESDDEEGYVKDEGYHSQNRRSSEVSPLPEGGAQGGAEPQEVEMTELKSETVNLIPPPRTSINDYRKDPCKSNNSNVNDLSVGEVTYIEVESVSLDDGISNNIPTLDLQSSDTNLKALGALETEYEEPVRAGVLDFPILKPLDKLDTSEYVECDHSDDSDESKYYVNESVLGIVVETSSRDGDRTDGELNTLSDRNYMNFDSVKHDNKQTKPIVFVESDTETLDDVTNTESKHEYVNLSSLETNQDAKVEIKLSSQMTEGKETGKSVGADDITRSKKPTSEDKKSNAVSDDNKMEIKIDLDNHTANGSSEQENDDSEEHVSIDLSSDKNRLLGDNKKLPDTEGNNDDGNDQDVDTRHTNDLTKLI